MKSQTQSFFYLNLSVGLSFSNMTPILNHVLQQFASRGRPQHRGIFLLLKYTRLVAHGDAVAVGFKVLEMSNKPE